MFVVFFFQFLRGENGGRGASRTGAGLVRKPAGTTR